MCRGSLPEVFVWVVCVCECVRRVGVSRIPCYLLADTETLIINTTVARSFKGIQLFDLYKQNMVFD